jgi:DUF1365 family protein
MTKSAIYQGAVMHRRHQPKAHQFRYPLFMMYLDLEELPSLFKPYWFWSYERFNWGSFWRSDHVGPKEQTLSEFIRTWIESEVGVRPTGPIRLLTHLRFLGYCFNPVSFYYIFKDQQPSSETALKEEPPREHLEYIVAEVSNTPWGERHCYLLHPGNEENLSKGGTSHEANPTEDSGLKMRSLKKHSYRIKKELHVSPFMEMDYEYQIQVTEPAEKILISMKNLRNNLVDFEAHLSLTKQEINSKNLGKILIKHPAMTIKIIVTIYWQALKLFLKGIPFINHPNTDLS